MAKNKDPAVLFYTSDFLVGVQGLTMEERGQYITLLCLQHQQGHLSEKTILLAVGNLSDDVKSKFDVDEDGLYYQHRMDEESFKRENYVTSRQVNGQKGGRPSKPKQNHMVNLQETYRKPYGKPTENLLENENINDNSNSINIEIKNTTTKSSETTQALYKRIRSEYIYTTQLDAKVTEWLQYKSERREPYKETGLKVLLRRIENSALEYGDEAVCDVIDDSIANGWKGIVFDKLGTARNAPTQGGKAKTDKECSVPRYSTFDAEEALQAALDKSYRDIPRD